MLVLHFRLISPHEALSSPSSTAPTVAFNASFASLSWQSAKSVIALKTLVIFAGFVFGSALFLVHYRCVGAFHVDDLEEQLIWHIIDGQRPSTEMRDRSWVKVRVL